MKKIYVLSFLLLIAILAAACAPAATTAPEEAQPVATEAPAEGVAATEVPTAEVPAGPQVGGTMVIGFATVPDTLDVSKAVGGTQYLQFIGSALLAQDPVTKEIIPNLAESWTISEDALTYTFKLREDVKFHNGNPMTAADYVWTIQRMLDPATASYCVQIAYQGVASVEEVDTFTFKVTLMAPNFYFLNALIFSGCTQPMDKEYAESAGDDLANNPIGVGPFKFVSYEPGVKMILERNPDFNWGPAYTHGGAPYIETLEIRVVSDPTTLLAAIESGELDFAGVNSPDVERVTSLGTHTLIGLTLGGNINSLVMNTAKAPLDDIRVREAINMALDREILNQVVTGGTSQIFTGALVPTTAGYCSDADSLGYGYDLEAAKALMEEVGYTYNADGMLEKDGQVLTMNMIVFSWRQTLATLVQEQLKALGIDVVMITGETGQLFGDLVTGNFDLFPGGYNIDTANTLNFSFNSAMIGSMNASQVSNPDLDAVLNTMVTTTDPAVNAQAACDAQKIIVEQAYTAPLYAEVMYYAVSNRIQGMGLPSPSIYELFDAYVVNP